MLGVVWCNDKRLNEEIIRSGHAGIYKTFCTESEFGSSNWAIELGCTNQMNSPQKQLQIKSACDAGNYIGDYVITEGYIADIFRSKTNTVFLNFEKPFPDNCFTAVIFSSDIGKFDNVNIYERKRVKIEGEIQSYEGKPEIILKDVSQIKII